MNKQNYKNSKTRKPKNRRVRNDRQAVLYRCFGNHKPGVMNYLPVWISAPMRYNETFTQSLVTNAFNQQSFRANSLFDPNRTSTGHQPLGFDQLAASYNRYVVDKVSWYISIPGSTDVFHASVGITNEQITVSSVATWDTFNECPTVRNQTSAVNGSVPMIFTGKKSLPHFYGSGIDKYYTDDSFQALVSASPAESIDLNVVLYNISGTTVSVRYTVNLKYRAIFFDPVTPTQSLKSKGRFATRARNKDDETDSVMVRIPPEVLSKLI